ncbi:SulP family inorganic anion transporter [Parelusimicrobium proximum]|uniref:SulP family inorganic anion transporter n=1 Tax=Parelusimicrobium proximum TaxID=3228953 RepID=UPI003D173541
MLKPKLYTLLKNRKEEFTPKNILRDLSAGLVVAFIAMPLSLALAIASGVSPEKGIITAVIGGFIVSLLGGSRVQIGGPTGAFVIIVSGIINQYGLAGLMAATFMAGIFLVIMGILRFGNVIKFIPYPVTTGFTAGIAVVLFSTQINDFLGLGLTDIPADFFDKWIMYFNNISHINRETLLIGILALVIMIFWPKKWRIVPGTIVAIVVTTLAVKFLSLDVETIFSRFGNIGRTLPRLTWPDLDLFTIKRLIVPSLVIAMLAGIESLLSAVVADGMINTKHRSNMELVAQGIANSASALFGGIPVTGAIARTTANVENGGRTPIAGISHAVFIFIITMLFMPYLSLVPMATLAAILFMVAYRMSEWRSFVSLFKAPVSDILVLLTTFTLTVVKDLIIAIEVGMVLAAFLFMKRMSDVYKVSPYSEEEENDDPIEDPEIDRALLKSKIQMYKIDGPFFFGAANAFADSLQIVLDYKVLILRMRNVPAMDATAFHVLNKIFKRCQKSGITLLFAGVQKQPMEVMKKYGFVNAVGIQHFFGTKRAALRHASKILKEEDKKSEEKKES